MSEHNSLRYYETAMLNAQKFQENYEGLSRSVGYDPNQEIKFKRNKQILRRIIKGIVLCAEQRISLFNEQLQQGYTILYKKLATQSCIHPLPKLYTEFGNNKSM